MTLATEPVRRPPPARRPGPRRGRARAVRALALGAWLGVALSGIVPGIVPGIAPAAAATAPHAVPEFLGATWYADGSCSLSVGGAPSVGRTAIDADFDEIGARTLVHCDTEDGRRVTILSRGGDALALGERVPLLSPDEIDRGLDGSIAWLALSGEGFADESAPRRFVLEGEVIIRSTPVTLTAGAAPHVDKQPFAELSGRVEPLVRSPPTDRAASAVR